MCSCPWFTGSVDGHRQERSLVVGWLSFCLSLIESNWDLVDKFSSLNSFQWKCKTWALSLNHDKNSTVAKSVETLEKNIVIQKCLGKIGESFPRGGTPHIKVWFRNHLGFCDSTKFWYSFLWLHNFLFRKLCNHKNFYKKSRRFCDCTIFWFRFLWPTKFQLFFLWFHNSSLKPNHMTSYTLLGFGLISKVQTFPFCIMSFLKWISSEHIAQPGPHVFLELSCAGGDFCTSYDVQ